MKDFETHTFLRLIDKLDKIDYHYEGKWLIVDGYYGVYLDHKNLTSMPDYVKFNNKGQVYLSYNELIELPKEIGILTNLKSLDLSNNQLKILPEEIGNLKNLTELDLHYNKLI